MLEQFTTLKLWLNRLALTNKTSSQKFKNIDSFNILREPKNINVYTTVKYQIIARPQSIAVHYLL